MFQENGNCEEMQREGGKIKSRSDKCEYACSFEPREKCE